MESPPALLQECYIQFFTNRAILFSNSLCILALYHMYNALTTKLKQCMNNQVMNPWHHPRNIVWNPHKAMWLEALLLATTQLKTQLFKQSSSGKRKMLWKKKVLQKSRSIIGRVLEPKKTSQASHLSELKEILPVTLWSQKDLFRVLPNLKQSQKLYLDISFYFDKTK